MQTIISIGITPYIIGTVESSSDNVAILDISIVVTSSEGCN